MAHPDEFWTELQAIARPLGTHHFAPILYHLAMMTDARATAEVGVFTGYVSHALGLAMKQRGGIHYAVDIRQDWLDDFAALAAEHGLPVECRLPGAIPPVDILHIDANHTYEGVAADIAMYAECVKPGGFICFHDYITAKLAGDRPCGVRRAIEEWLGDEWEYIVLPFYAGEFLARRKDERSPGRG